MPHKIHESIIFKFSEKIIVKFYIVYLKIKKINIIGILRNKFMKDKKIILIGFLLFTFVALSVGYVFLKNN